MLDTEYLHDVVVAIDLLVYEARRLSGKAKITKLKEAQRLADLYQKQVEAGGNFVKQFKTIL